MSLTLCIFCVILYEYCHRVNPQSWLDIVNTINRDSALYGIGLNPLELDPLMPEPINIDQEMVGYQVYQFQV